MATCVHLTDEITTLRERLQILESRTRLAIRTMALLRKRLMRMGVSIEDSAIIFTHLNDIEALLAGEVLSC